MLFPQTYSFSNPSEFLVLNLNNAPYGMFSVFNYVVGGLYHYEKNSYMGVEVDFENFGLYYQPTFGNNWWNYYCYPIKIGKKDEAPFIKNCRSFQEYADYAMFTEKKLNRLQVNELIQKYITILPPIQIKIENFVRNHFGDSHIIAIHYRGTDKIHEAPRVSYETISEQVKDYINSNQLFNYKIFIASDEQQFVNYMEEVFFAHVIVYDAARSSNGLPLHYDSTVDNFKKGEEALIDCILLSRGNILFRTSSNLSLWSGYFNPYLPIKELSSRFNDTISNWDVPL
jgi:hypothetical protein